MPGFDSLSLKGRGVILLAHGTPESLDQIEEYLSNVTGGRPLPAAAIEEVRRRYALIGSSPLTRLTLAQAHELQRSLALPVFVGMRNWRPYIAAAVQQMRTAGISEAVAICLAPQNSRTSVGLYRRSVLSALEEGMRVEFIEAWADHPLLALAFAERLLPVWRSATEKFGCNVPVIFTAHSVPCRTIQSGQAGQSGQARQADQASQAESAAPEAEKPAAGGAKTGRPSGEAAEGGAVAAPDSYSVEAKRTAANVAALLADAGLTSHDWFFAFQSQGMSGGPWLGPAVEETLSSLRQQGHRAIVIQPVGFLCDHVEILYDIDIGFRALARELGMELLRPPSLNESPRLIAALTDLARQGFAALDARPDDRSQDEGAEAVAGRRS